MQLLYNFFIHLYTFAFRLAAFFIPKAKLAVDGRNNWEEDLKRKINVEDDWIWMHCSSLGEFEQGRPVFEALKAEYPAYKLALSFFSPSGYEIRKDYALADAVFYFPFDTAGNAKKLTEIFQPKLWILVKYDYWYNHLKFQYKTGTKIVVISAIFRENQIYFQPYGKWFSSKLKKYISHFFVQNQTSEQLLQKIGIENVTVSGDTRFDRVKSIAAQTETLDWIESFKSDKKLMVVGSSWKDDEDLWVQFINESLPADWKVVIVPHEIKADKIQQLKNSMNKEVVLLSEFSEFNLPFISAPLDERTKSKNNTLGDLGGNPDILIVDAIGFLSKIYASADIAYVGGGFNKSGVHNTLEPAVFGVPVVIGPNFEKFNEVKMLKKEGVIYSVSNYPEFKNIMSDLFQNEAKRASIRQKASEVFENQLPSTQIIVNSIRQIIQ